MIDAKARAEEKIAGGHPRGTKAAMWSGGGNGRPQPAAASKEGWHEFPMDWRALASHWKAFRLRHAVMTKAWLIRGCTALLLWSCLFHGMSCFRDLWQSPLMRSSCVEHFPRRPLRSALAEATSPFGSSPGESWGQSSTVPPYKSNGYLLVSCNGGLNQMRAAICDMVAVTKHMNVTLVIPELDKTSFWQDPSDFGDIFDVDHFISSLRDEVHIVRELPEEYAARVKADKYLGLPPRSWSSATYYSKVILPLVQKHEILRLNKTDARLANNGLPLAMQKLRCRVNYHSLRFTPRIEQLGQKLVQILRERGKFLVLHLRYEMDMLAFTGCTQGCTQEEAENLTRMRYASPWWKEKRISSDKKRKAGLCPLTPEETALVLRALGYGRDTQVYIAAGEIYGNDRRVKALEDAFPNLVRKEMLLSDEEMRPFFNRSSQMAALDYLVSLASDVFIPTYHGNMAKVVEGHRRYLGFRKSIRLDRGKLVELLDAHDNKTMPWDAFARAVKGAHEGRMGSRARRRVVVGKPKEEEYFYSNPEECICDEEEPFNSSSASHSTPQWS